MIGRRDGKLKGGVGEIAAGPRDLGGLFGEAAGVGERAGNKRDVVAGGVDGFLDPPVRGGLARVGVGRPAAELLGAGSHPRETTRALR